MNFAEAVKAFFANYINFTGRASRSEFWYIMLLNTLLLVLLYIVYVNVKYPLAVFIILSFFSLYETAVIIPTISLYVRRFHDLGLSGLWMLIALLPGGVVATTLYCIKGSVPENQWGDTVNGTWADVPKTYTLEDYGPRPPLKDDDPYGFARENRW